MYKQIIISFYLFFVSAGLFAQTEFGAEYQLSLGKSFSGHNIGGLYEGFSNTGKTSWQLGVSYTLSSSLAGKSSSQDNNWNIHAGVRYGFSYGNDGNLFGGFRISYGFGKEDVINPSAELGYHYTFNNFAKGGFTTPSIGLGYSLPLKTDDDAEDRYEGLTVNMRLAAGYRF